MLARMWSCLIYLTVLSFRDHAGLEFHSRFPQQTFFNSMGLLKIKTSMGLNPNSWHTLWVLLIITTYFYSINDWYPEIDISFKMISFFRLSSGRLLCYLCRTASSRALSPFLFYIYFLNHSLNRSGTLLSSIIHVFLLQRTRAVWSRCLPPIHQTRQMFWFWLMWYSCDRQRTTVDFLYLPVHKTESRETRFTKCA